MHVKVLNGWSNKSFDMLELLRAAFPMCSSIIPSSFYEPKWKLRGLGLGYKTIHTCKYNCVLYWKKFVDLQHCPTCSEGKKFCIKYCATFLWCLDYSTCLYRRKGLLTWDNIEINMLKQMMSWDIQLMQRSRSTLILNFLILLLIHETCVWVWLQMSLTHLIK